MQITKEGESDQQIDETVNLTLYRYDVRNIIGSHSFLPSVISILIA